ncbi:MAG: SDR family oxidoreductase [Legionellales bacterium]|nr:SDR family oxidoreductase [Legionellales bacterium]
MKKVVILGCGDIGVRLAKLLLAQGHEVMAVRRNIKSIPDNVPCISIDLTDKNQINRLPIDIDTVVYCASADQHTETAYEDIYVRGLENCLEFFSKLKLSPSLTFTSSTSIYPQVDGSWVDENSPLGAQHFPARMMLRAETLLQAAAVDHIIVRAAGIYGPGRLHLIEQIRNQTIILANHYTNRIHADDLAHIILHLISQTRLAHTIYNATDNCPTPQHEVVTWLAKMLNQPILNTQIQTDDPHGLRGNKRVSNQRLLETGYEMLYPDFHAGYQAILNNLCDQDESTTIS